MTLTAGYEGYHNLATLDFDIFVYDACLRSKIAVTSSLLASHAFPYKVGSGPLEIFIDESAVQVTPFTAQCLIEYKVASIVDTDDTSSQFSIDTEQLKIVWSGSSDVNLPVQWLKIEIGFAGYSASKELAFSINPYTLQDGSSGSEEVIDVGALTSGELLAFTFDWFDQ